MAGAAGAAELDPPKLKPVPPAGVDTTGSDAVGAGVDAEDPNVKPVPVLVFFAGVGVASIAGGSLVESAPKEKPVLLLSFAVDASAAGVDDAPNENPVPLPLLSSAAVLEAPHPVVRYVQ